MGYVKEEVSFRIAFLCYLSYLIVIAFGHLRDFLKRVGIEQKKGSVERNREVTTAGGVLISRRSPYQPGTLELACPHSHSRLSIELSIAG